MKFIHYGHFGFEKDKFNPIQNRECENKPKGGLWASSVTAKYGWEKWCQDNEFEEYCKPDHSFMFSLKPEANIYYIGSLEAADNLPRTKSKYDIKVPSKIIMGVDFEAMVKGGIDAILYDQSSCPELYWRLNGWDCDCILIMNPDIIVAE